MDPARAHEWVPWRGGLLTAGFCVHFRARKKQPGRWQAGYWPGLLKSGVNQRMTYMDGPASRWEAKGGGVPAVGKSILATRSASDREDSEATHVLHLLHEREGAARQVLQRQLQKQRGREGSEGCDGGWVHLTAIANGDRGENGAPSLSTVPPCPLRSMQRPGGKRPGGRGLSAGVCVPVTDGAAFGCADPARSNALVVERCMGDCKRTILECSPKRSASNQGAASTGKIRCDGAEERLARSKKRGGRRRANRRREWLDQEQGWGKDDLQVARRSMCVSCLAQVAGHRPMKAHRARRQAQPVLGSEPHLPPPSHSGHPPCHPPPRTPSLGHTIFLACPCLSPDSRSPAAAPGQPSGTRKTVKHTRHMAWRSIAARHS
jgi:hypothetical protein